MTSIWAAGTLRSSPRSRRSASTGSDRSASLNLRRAVRLWLLSIQLTTGLVDALTIADLVAKLRSRLVGADLEAFEKKLYSAGWRDKYRADHAASLQAAIHAAAAAGR